MDPTTIEAVQVNGWVPKTWLEIVLYSDNTILWKSCTMLLDGLYLPLLGFLGVIFLISMALLSMKTSLGALRADELLNRLSWITGSGFVAGVIPQLLAFLTSGQAALSCTGL